MNNGSALTPTDGIIDLGTVITSHQDISGKADKSAAIGSLSLSMDSSTYVITLSGTKVDGTAFTVSGTIDLPLESVVVNGSYDSTNKKVILTLKNNNTIEISVADLISGLQSEITSSNKLSADLISDGTTNKAYTATEQTKLSGIATGAQVNTIETVKVNGSALTPDANKAVDISATPKVATTTDNAIARYDGTGGAIQNSGVTIDDSDQVTASKFITDGGTSSQFVKGDGTLDSTSYAPLASPALTGTPTAPTASSGTNTTQVATTAFVQGEIGTALGNIETLLAAI